MHVPDAYKGRFRRKAQANIKIDIPKDPNETGEGEGLGDGVGTASKDSQSSAGSEATPEKADVATSPVQELLIASHNQSRVGDRPSKFTFDSNSSPVSRK